MYPLNPAQKGDKDNNILIINKMKEEKTYRKILTDSTGDVVRSLMKTFGCCKATVHNALNGKHMRKRVGNRIIPNERAIKIRHRAIQLGLREKGEEKVTILH